jgi:LPS sulfotransferase NodH
MAGGYVTLEPFQRTMRKRGIRYGSEKFSVYKDEILGKYAAVKHLWNSPALTREILNDPRATPVLLLERQDVFAAALSTVVAAATRNFSRKRPKSLERPIPIAQLRERIEMITRGQSYWRGWLEGRGLPYQLATYESLYSSKTVEEAEIKIAELCDFLSLPKENLKAAASLIMPQRKYSPFSFYKTAPNWPELARAFHLSDDGPAPQ